MILNELLHVVIVPFTVATCAAFACRRMRAAPAVVSAASIGLGYIAGQLALSGRSGVSNALTSFLEPREAVDWLPHAVLLAIGISLLASYPRRVLQRIATALAIALVIGLPLRLLAGSAYTEIWSPLEKLAYLALLSASLGLMWLVLGSAQDDQHIRLRPPLLVAVAAGAALIAALSGVLVYGELCGTIVAAIAGSIVAAILSAAAAAHTFPRHALDQQASAFGQLTGAAGVITCSLASLILLGCFYAKLTPVNALLLFVAMMFACTRLPGFLASRAPWQQSAVRIALTLIPLAAAVTRAISAANADLSATPYSVYG